MGSSTLLLLNLAFLAAYTLLPADTLASAAAAAPEDCNSKCGNVDISYPFGTTEHCFKDPDFQIICLQSSSTGLTIPYLAREIEDIYDQNIEVLKISGNTSEIFVSMPVFNVCYDPEESYNLWGGLFWVPSKFGISDKKNKFNLVGCNSYAFLYDRKEKALQGCNSDCSSDDQLTKNYGTCHNDLVGPVTNYTITAVFYSSQKAQNNNATSTTMTENPARCSYAFIAQNGAFNFPGDLKKLRESNRSTVVLDWAFDINTTSSCGCKANKSECRKSESVSGSYYCACKQGFEGNPYTDHGCQDVDECLNSTLNNCLHQDRCQNLEGGYECSCPSGQKGNGRIEGGTGSGCSNSGHDIITPLVVAIALLVVFTLIYMLCWANKQRTMKQLRHRNFEQNGGNLLLQQLSQQQGYTERTKIFTEAKLKHATNNFNESRILGRRGQGTVYKGIFPDNTLVAIKKSKVGGDPQNIRSFINKVFVLSQINHRNVVKLLGCCLETEVPLLVYEFVDNGTLLDHLDSSKNECFITWETRLRIATEIAKAISCLHSAASVPIIHRDIKSANILLDHKDQVKVSDFEASKLIHLDEVQVATIVQGTRGYVDPEYLQTGQLTEKSDVYSFGIVLVELLTGIKAFEFNTLVKHFVSSIREDRLWEIIDKQVLDQKKNAEQLKEVALLAKRCIRAKGEERPTMKEVAMELEGMLARKKHLQERNKDIISQESEHLLRNYSKSDAYVSTNVSFSVASSYDSIQKHATFEIIDGGR